MVYIPNDSTKDTREQRYVTRPPLNEILEHKGKSKDQAMYKGDKGS
jgi:hypothetical protein